MRVTTLMIVTALGETGTGLLLLVWACPGLRAAAWRRHAAPERLLTLAPDLADCSVARRAVVGWGQTGRDRRIQVQDGGLVRRRRRSARERCMLTTRHCLPAEWLMSIQRSRVSRGWCPDRAASLEKWRVASVPAFLLPRCYHSTPGTRANQPCQPPRADLRSGAGLGRPRAAQFANRPGSSSVGRGFNSQELPSSDWVRRDRLLPGFYWRTAHNAVQPEPTRMVATPRFWPAL